MHLTQVQIGKFRVLDDITVRFLAPAGDGTNVVNVVAGVNGCGKTSLLQAVVQRFSERDNPNITILRVLE
jgi:predicted ATP-dependent endonuclease of OLD family